MAVQDASWDVSCAVFAQWKIFGTVSQHGQQHFQMTDESPLNGTLSALTDHRPFDMQQSHQGDSADSQTDCVTGSLQSPLLRETALREKDEWNCTTWKVLLAASHVFTKPNLKFEIDQTTERLKTKRCQA